MTKILVLLIKIYQATLSPDHSFWSKYRFPLGYCRFYPSCSTFMIESLQKKGLIKGFFKGSYRILRCNPYSRGGFDPVLKH